MGAQIIHAYTHFSIVLFSIYYKWKCIRVMEKVTMKTYGKIHIIPGIRVISIHAKHTGI